MPITVKKIILWRAEVENQPGVLARTLELPAKAGADFRIVMGYRHPAAERKAAIEVFPVSGKKAASAAAAAGLSAAEIPALLVEGDNRPGLGHKVAQAIADAGINVAFFMGQAIGRKFAAVIGFETEDDAGKAIPAIKKGVKKVKA
jgi:hypothetical protein